MVKVICDTSFLMILASTNVKNISNLDTEIGTIEFMVPDMVVDELEKISKSTNLKKTFASNAIRIIKNFEKIKISGSSVDNAIVSYIKNHKGIVATVDIDLKKRIRNFGGSILSLANDKIVLEPSKI